MMRTSLLLAVVVAAGCASWKPATPDGIRTSIERRDGVVYYKGAAVDPLNVGDRLNSLLRDLKSAYKLEKIELQLFEPATGNYLMFPEVQLDAVMLDTAVGGPKFADEAARGIARAVYDLSYDALKRGVSVSLYRKAAAGNARFFAEVLIRPEGLKQTMSTKNLDETPLNDKRRLK